MEFMLGLIALVAGAELLVRGASKLALSFGISPLVVGLTVVAFGTSSPELAVSVQSAWSGQVDIALGNVVGSNLFNVLFILGVSALIVPLVVHRQLIRQEVPVMVGVSLLAWALAADGGIGRVDGLFFVALLVGYTVFLIRQSRRQAVSHPPSSDPLPDMGSTWDRHWSVQVLMVIGGLGLLVLGSNTLVDAAIALARQLGVSELVVGLTIVAAGTSLPEVATSIVAAIRGQRDIAVGNVVGSNTFNILAVIGATGLIAGGVPVSDAARNFDLWVMLAVAFACVPIMLSGREIARWEGVVFLAYYTAYTLWLALSAQRHEALPAFSGVMLSYVLPITVVTLVVSVLRQRPPAARDTGR